MYEYFYEAFLRVFFDVIGRGSGFLIIISFFFRSPVPAELGRKRSCFLGYIINCTINASLS